MVAGVERTRTLCIMNSDREVLKVDYRSYTAFDHYKNVDFHSE